MTTLQAARRALQPGGGLVFETRDPAAEAWRSWTRDQTYRRADIGAIGRVETWVEVTAVTAMTVRFQTTFIFERDGAVLTSESTLRFRGRDEVLASLEAAGFLDSEVREAPDRPGLELVFVTRPTA